MNQIHYEKIRATRATQPAFPESLTRKLYRKKIPEKTLRLPGLPGLHPGSANPESVKEENRGKKGVEI
jgi:hypothetical protein